jgi:hypothetical protein
MPWVTIFPPKSYIRGKEFLPGKVHANSEISLHFKATLKVKSSYTQHDPFHEKYKINHLMVKEKNL